MERGDFVGALDVARNAGCIRQLHKREGERGISSLVAPMNHYRIPLARLQAVTGIFGWISRLEHEFLVENSPNIVSFPFGESSKLMSSRPALLVKQIFFFNHRLKLHAIFP